MGPVTAPCAEDPRADLLAGTKEIGSGASASAVPKTIVQKRPQLKSTVKLPPPRKLYMYHHKLQFAWAPGPK